MDLRLMRDLRGMLDVVLAAVARWLSMVHLLVVGIYICSLHTPTMISHCCLMIDTRVLVVVYEYVVCMNSSMSRGTIPKVRQPFLWVLEVKFISRTSISMS
jgi:hypothetical protein